MKNWQIAPVVNEQLKDKFPEINPIILQLLVNRGLISQQQIDQFLNPDYSADLYDPFLFIDMEKAAKRILEAIQNQEKIVVYGDYDADGVSSTAILSEALKALGSKVEVYIPFRETEGYGLNLEAAKELAKQGTQLLITVDCGVSNAPEVDELNKHKVDVIITDHHQEPLVLPNAFAIINHNTSRDTYPYKNLSGAGVAFKVVQALILRHQSYKVNQLSEGWEKWLLDITAIGTVTDMMVLLGENRTLVKYGLTVLQKTKRIGLQELMKVANGDIKKVDERSIGFQIGPRLNAAGRLEHANTAYELLITEDKDEAKDLAQSINTTNQQRQTLTETITKEAKAMLGEIGDEKLLAVVGDGWPTGVVGLIAGRIADQNYRPTLIISNFGGETIGSGRSVEGFNIVKALQQCDQYLSRYGGHAQACGFTIKDKKSVKPFIKKIKEIAQKELADKTLIPNLDIDVEINLPDINWRLFEQIEEFRPFGIGNSKPRFIAKNLTVFEAQGVGQDGKHMRLMISDKDSKIHKTIGFGFGDWSDKLNKGDLVDLVFEVDVNEWNGNRELQLKIVDLKLSEN